MKIVSVHKLHQVRAFAQNHSKHEVLLIDGGKPTIKIKTSGKPFDEKSAEYEAELLDGELQFLRSYVEVVLKKCFINSTVELTEKQLNQIIDFIEMNLYQDMNLENEIYSLTDEMRDGFEFKKGQIITIGFKTDESHTENLTPVKMLVPAIITNVHDSDENQNVSYDFIIPVRGSDCEFESWIESKKRYAWRFNLKDIYRPCDWFIQMLKDNPNTFDKWEYKLKMSDLFYIDKDVANKKDMFVNYPFRKDV